MFNYFFIVMLSLIPGIIWLLFYLRKDVHPEPNLMIIKVFLYGALITVPVFFIQLGMTNFFPESSQRSDLIIFLYYIFVVGFTEEISKYLVIKNKVLKSSEVDEPTDIILYMIIAGLGFATLENIVYLFDVEFPDILFITAFRFLGPIFLHALCSGTIGYFLAKSFFDPKQKIKLLIYGFSLAILLHGIYNFSIIKIIGLVQSSDKETIIINPLLFGVFSFILLAILIGLAIFVSFGFKELRKLKSICKKY